jgi:hypothetical protein
MKLYAILDSETDNLRLFSDYRKAKLCRNRSKQNGKDVRIITVRGYRKDKDDSAERRQRFVKLAIMRGTRT